MEDHPTHIVGGYIVKGVTSYKPSIIRLTLLMGLTDDGYEPLTYKSWDDPTSRIQAGIEILELQREINERSRSSENLLPATVFFGAFVVVRKLVPLHYVAYEFVDFLFTP